MRNRFAACALVLLLTFSLGAFGLAQTSRVKPVSAAPSSLLAALPPSDAVALVKVKRVLDEVMPKMLARNPTRLAQANAEIERFKARTGLDLRSFDQLGLGMRYTYPAEGIIKVNTVALATGTFSAGAITAAGRIAANGKYQEQQYQGKTIYIFNLEQQTRLLGLLDLRLTQLAVSPLDANTLALGDLQSVRSAIDVNKRRKRGNEELIALASRDPNAIIGFGGNISPTLIQNLRVSNDTIARDLTAVRQMYGSVGFTERDFEVMLAARAVDEYAARNLGNTVESLKQFGALFVNRLPAAKSALARSALGNLVVSSQGNELQIRTVVAQSELAPLMGGD